jgi:hypothetical protein
MEVEAEWAALVAPYAAAAERLGFSFVERSVVCGVPPSPDTTFGCTDFHFDRHATFLDLGGTLARGPHHRGLLIGFHGVQLYTYLRTPTIVLVLTNGSSPEAVARLAKARWNPLMRLAEALTPKDFSSIPMRGPDDLAMVIERHRERVAKRGGEPIEITGSPLESRWALHEEWDRSDTPW